MEKPSVQLYVDGEAETQKVRLKGRDFDELYSVPPQFNEVLHG